MNRFFRYVAILIGLTGGLITAKSPVDTLVVQLPFEPVTLDPTQSYEGSGNLVIENIYETLYSYKGESLSDYAPGLAVSYEVSSNDKRYTFSLRRGVKFHSGNSFTCRDVEYTFERALVVNFPISGVWFLAESLLGTRSNANAELGNGATEEAYKAYWTKIDRSVECIDAFTVQFTLPAPDATFFTKLLSPVSSIVDYQWAVEQGLWDGTAATWREWVGVDLRNHRLHEHPSGTGAYRLVSWDASGIIAERFGSYWGMSPALKYIFVQDVEDATARILALKQGDADTIATVDRPMLSQLRGLPGVTVHEQDHWAQLGVALLAFNADISPDENPNLGSGQLGEDGIPPDFFADANMRRCVAYAFDHNVFIKDVLQGHGTKLTMALPPTFPSYAPDLPTYDGNLSRAQNACRKAHNGQVWHQGFRFTALHPADSAPDETVFQILKTNLEALNAKFHIESRGVSWPELLGALDAGKGTVFTVGVGPDYPDPDAMLNIYASDGLFSLSTNFSDAQIDALLDKARSTTNQVERDALYRRVGERAHTLMPLVPLPSGKPFLVARSNVQGLYYNPIRSGSFLWKDIRKE